MKKVTDPAAQISTDPDPHPWLKYTHIAFVWTLWLKLYKDEILPGAI